jgi:ERCC4-type nuclease
LFVSPTEPPELRNIGITSSMPEEHGVDVMWKSKLGMVGVQRKVFPGDFLSSMKDGRLVKEFLQMKQLDVSILLLEGVQHWTTEGELYGAYGASGRTYTWSRHQHRNYLASVQLRGIQVQTSDSITDTIDYLHHLQLWTDKGDHQSLDRRPNLQSNGYQSLTNEDYVRYFYQNLPGVGPTAAAMIYNYLGIILQLKVGVEELMIVPGIGKGKARKIVEMFDPTKQKKEV